MAKPSWLNINPTTGSGNGTIANSASEHTGRVARTGTVTVTGSGVSNPATYTVTQTPKEEFASFNNGTSMSVDKVGGTVTVAGKSNSSKLTFAWVGTSDVTMPTTYVAAGTSATSGTAITGDPGASSQFDFSIEFEFPENETIDDITRALKVTANGGQSAQITITQAAGDATLRVTPTEITIPQDGSAVSVTVESNTSWTVS